MIYVTDMNYKEVLPTLSNVQIHDMIHDMPAKPWMQKEIQRRIKVNPYLADWFYDYLDLCFDMAERQRAQREIGKYRYCS